PSGRRLRLLPGRVPRPPPRGRPVPALRRPGAQARRRRARHLRLRALPAAAPPPPRDRALGGGDLLGEPALGLGLFEGREAGEGDRVLHLYTPHRGRVGAIAKGARKTRSRFGGRLEPFFHLRLVLHEGRSDLLTVTSAETVAPHARLRDDRAGLDAAARACDAVARLFEAGDPNPAVFHLLANELGLLD